MEKGLCNEHPDTELHTVFAHESEAMLAFLGLLCEETNYA